MTPAVIGIVAAATLIVVPGLFQRSDSSIASASVAPTTNAPQETPASAPVDTTKTATKLVATAAAAEIPAPETSAVGRPVIEPPRTPAIESTRYADAIAHAKPTPLLTPPADSATTAKPKLLASTHVAPNPRPEPPTRADATNEGAVTVSGCLQARDGSFWLKDPVGANAPTSRSWKSGFLKKHVEPVQIVDSTRALQFSNYVAQRVTATGTLADRTLRVRSLERAAPSCR